MLLHFITFYIENIIFYFFIFMLYTLEIENRKIIDMTLFQVIEQRNLFHLILLFFPLPNQLFLKQLSKM